MSMSGAEAGYVWAWSAWDHGAIRFSFVGEQFETDNEAYLTVLRNHMMGRTLRPEEFPTRLWVRTKYAEEDEKRLPQVLLLGNLLAVSDKVAGIMRDFDLGDAFFVPVTLLKSDRTTEFDGAYSIFHTTEMKDGFEPEQSTGYTPNRYPEKPHLGLVSYLSQSDGDNKVNASVLSGSDVWKDPRLSWELFVSGALGDALRKAKVLGKSKMLRCDVIGGR